MKPTVLNSEMTRAIKKDKRTKHPKCKGNFDYWGEFDCDYPTTIICDDCKYGVGRKDPEAKCNQLKGD